MILLDTDIIIAHLKGDPRVTERILSHLPDIAIPAVVLAELDFGAEASARPAENLERLYALVRAVPVVPFDAGCASDHAPCRRRSDALVGLRVPWML